MCCTFKVGTSGRQSHVVAISSKAERAWGHLLCGIALAPRRGGVRAGDRNCHGCRFLSARPARCHTHDATPTRGEGRCRNRRVGVTRFTRLRTLVRARWNFVWPFHPQDFTARRKRRILSYEGYIDPAGFGYVVANKVCHRSDACQQTRMTVDTALTNPRQQPGGRPVLSATLKRYWHASSPSAEARRGILP